MNTLMNRNAVPTVNRLFTQLFNEPFFADAPRLALAGSPCEPGLPLDVSETERELIVRASVPGFGKDQIDVEVRDGVLTIKAEHTEQAEDSGETWLRRERRSGSVSRRVALPDTVADTEPRAELRDGVLTLWLPKAAKALPKKVRIG